MNKKFTLSNIKDFLLIKFFSLIFIFLLQSTAYSQALSGNYIIGNSNMDTNFKTLAAATAHINLVGVSKAVTFLIDENQSVTSQIEIKHFTGSSAINTLTIKPNVGRNITVAGNINGGAIIVFNSAENVVIDGKYNASAENNLTIYNKNNFEYGQRAGVWIFNGSNNNIIRNLKINLEIGGINIGIPSIGIYAGGDTLMKGGNNPKNTIENVRFKNVKQAIMVIGIDQKNIDWSIKNNFIESTDNGTKAFLGIYVLNGFNLNISGNLISGIRLPVNLSGSSIHSAIYLENSNNCFVVNNKIFDIQNSVGYSTGYGIYIKGNSNQIKENVIKDLNSNSATDGSYGIRSEGNNTTISKNNISNVFSSNPEGKNTNGIYISGNDQLLYNNFVYDVKAVGGGGTSSQNGFGIYVNSGSNLKLYFNTVVLNTNQNRGVSAALFIKESPETNKIDIRNNIFLNKQTDGNTKRFAVYSQVTKSSKFISLDYNNYFSTQAIGVIGDFNTPGTIYQTLEKWKEATGKDLNSLSFLPVFVSPVDLHLDSCVNDVLKAGVNIKEVEDDIDGEVRSSPPYIGADEIISTPVKLSVMGNGQICSSTDALFTITGMPGSAVKYTINGGAVSQIILSGNGVESVAIKNAKVNQTLTIVSASDLKCLGPVNPSATVTVGATTVYNNGWEITPSATSKLNAEIRSAYSTSIPNLNLCSLIVTNNSPVIINAGNAITVQNGITVDPGSSLTIKSDGNLIQNNDGATNVGNIMVEKLFNFVDGSISANDRKQYNYVISPVVNQNIKTIYPGNPIVITHREANNFFYNSDGSYIAGRGYAVKEPTKLAVSENIKMANFVGKPFNGLLQYPLAYSTTQANPLNRGFNLVGNPYPSNIDIDKLYANNKGKIEATFYFWDNRGNTQYSQQGSGYYGDNYAKYNALSNTGVSSGVKIRSAFGSARIPKKDVKVGTAFMVQALSTANGKSLDFNNSLRTETAGPEFLGKTNTTVNKNRFWLTVKTPSEMQFMSAVVYFEEGSDQFGAEDTESFGGSDDIFTILDDHELAIQGRSRFQNTDKLDLGLSLFQTGIHTISINEKEGIFDNGQSIFLKDKQTGIITNLSEGSYVFDAAKGNIKNRFEIVYKPETFLATNSAVKEQLIVYKNMQNFVIKAQSKKITDVELYDSSGKLVYKITPNSTEVILQSDILIRGIYILKISQNNQLTVKKIIK